MRLAVEPLVRPQTIGIRSHVPQTRFVLSTTARMYLVSAAALCAVIQSSISDNFMSLWVALAAVASAFAAEALMGFLSNHRRLFDGSAMVTGLILTLLLPNTIPPAFAAFGAFFAIAVIKYTAGGLGANWLNPALGGALAVRFAFSTVWETSLEHMPLGAVQFMSDSSFVSSTAESVSVFLNENVFSGTSIRLPAEYIDLFSFYPSAIIADRGLFALIIGSIFILSAISFRVWMPWLYLAVYILLVRFSTPGQAGDMFYALCSGGTLLTAFFLVSDPVTAPKSARGNFVYVVCAASLSFVFRFIKLELYGAFFAVALMNTLVPALKTAEEQLLYGNGRLR